jgi:hypothetical protein
MQVIYVRKFTCIPVWLTLTLTEFRAHFLSTLSDSYVRTALFRILVVVSRRVLSKPCFQVFIVSPLAEVHGWYFLILAFGSSRRPPSLVDVVLNRLGR